MSELHEMNVAAQTEIVAEMTKLGLKPETPAIVETNPNNNNDENKSLDKKDEETEEESEEESEKSEEKAEDENEEESEESKESKPHSKKRIPIEKHLSEKRALKEQLAEKDKIIEQLTNGVNKETQAEEKETDADFDTAFEAAMKEMGITDETQAGNLKKLLSLARIGDKKAVAELQKKVDLFEERERDKKLREEQEAEEKTFQNSWNITVENIEKEFGTLSKDQKEEALAMMQDLLKEDKWKNVKDLDYIFFKNREEFVESLALEKKSGLQRGQTQVRNKEQQQAKVPTLPENPTDEDFKRYERELGESMSTSFELKDKGKERI